MSILLYSILFVITLAIIVAFLPIKFFLHATGGEDDGVDFEFRIMFSNGLFGGGIRSEEKQYVMSLFLLSHPILCFQVTNVLTRISERIKTAPRRAKGKEKSKPEAKKGTWPFKLVYRLTKEILTFLKWGIKEFKEMIIFESLDAYFTIGFGYPHITGMIVGFLYALNGLLPEKYTITPHWNFSRQIISGNCTMRITVRAYIFWYKLFTSIPAAGYRQRTRIKYWINVLRHKNSLQEA